MSTLLGERAGEILNIPVCDTLLLGLQAYQAYATLHDILCEYWDSNIVPPHYVASILQIEQPP